MNANNSSSFVSGLKTVAATVATIAVQGVIFGAGVAIGTIAAAKIMKKD